MSILLDEKVIGVWYLEPDPNMNVLMSAHHVEDSTDIIFYRRYRYYDGDQDKDAFDDGDTKEWYSNQVKGIDAEKAISLSRTIMEAMLTMGTNKTKRSYEILRRDYESFGDFVDAFQRMPFTQCKAVDPSGKPLATQ